ncbi:MAG: LacI family DNA-binding transcriptional regulator [Lachnospiraceae bacterium]|nr:LacI family DNA-binding transcriptional regulator [Lachnospiraceae bacterium]
MATIKDIAALSGVSRGTVDRVLNNRKGVHPDTRSKVLAVTKSLDYRPNKAGMVLSAQRKNLKFGVVMFGTNNPFFDDVRVALSSITSELSRYNCEIMIRSTPGDSDKDQIDAIDELVKAGISGLAIAPQNQEGVVKKIDELYKKHIPTVTFNSDLPTSKRIAYVGSDYRKSGRTIAGLMKLIDHVGQLEIGVVGGLRSVLCHTERIEGFKDVAKETSNMHIVDTVWSDDDDLKCHEVVRGLLSSHPEINAMYFTAGAIEGGCRAIKELGREKGMIVLTHDKVPSTCALIEEGLIQATVCQQPAIQGTMPLQILFDYLTIGEKPKALNYTDTEIYIKENL